MLEDKLAVILEEFGVDKTSDVLDSAEAANMFDHLYVDALLHPDRIAQSVEQLAETIKARAGEAHSKNTLLANGGALSPDEARNALNQPLAEWVERMTENYLDAFGGKYEAELDCLKIQWPGETQMRRYALPTRTGTPPPKTELLRLDHPRVRGMQLGAVGMSNQVRTWAEEGFPLALLNRLREQGFDVFISADHGNTEAVGIGRPQEGVLSDKRGERCRIYSDPTLRKRCLADFAGTQTWENAGLPENISTLLSPYGKAFTQENTTLLCHGGAALEEVCVPFIRIPAHV